MWFSQILLLLLNYEEDFSPIPHLSRCMSTIAIGSFLIKPRPHLDYNTFKGCIPERQNLRTLIEIQTPKKLDICMCILMNQLHTPHATDYSLPIIIMHVQRHLRLGLHLQLMCFPPRIQESVRLEQVMSFTDHQILQFSFALINEETVYLQKYSEYCGFIPLQICTGSTSRTMLDPIQTLQF